MWDFILGPDGIRSQQINLVWLGMNPNFYNHLLKEEEHAFNNLQISEICDKIWSSVSNLRLNMISNLLKAACMVHKVQVDCLYSKTRDLFCYQKSASLNSSSFNVFSEENMTSYLSKTSQKIKKPRNTFISFDSESILEEIEDINPTYNETNNFLIPSNTCLDTDITLKETSNKLYITSESDNDEELLELGEMSSNEKIYFLDILNLRNKGMKRNCNKEPNNLRVLDISNLASKFSEEIDEYNFEFDVPRHQTVNKNDSFDLIPINQTTLNRTNIADENKNLEISSDVRNIDTSIILGSEHNDNVLLELPCVTTNNFELPDYNCFIKNIERGSESEIAKENQSKKRTSDENFSKLSNYEMKRRKTQLKIDRTIEFTVQQIISYTNSPTYRWSYPRQDIVPKKQFGLKSSDKLMVSPCLRLPLPLLTYFKRNLKRRKEIKKVSLCDIDGISFFSNNIPIKRRRCTANLIISPLRKCKKNENDVESYVAEAINSGEELQFNPKINSSSSFNQSCIEEIIKIIQKCENLEPSLDNECSLMFKKLKNEWNQSAVLRKLSHLWISNDKHVTMEVLCNNIKRQAAAIAFSSIIQLSAKKYINIIKEENSNSIVNIEMGSSITSKL